MDSQPTETIGISKRGIQRGDDRTIHARSTAMNVSGRRTADVVDDD